MNCVLGIQGKKWVMLKVSQKKGWVKYLRRRVNNVLSIPGHALNILRVWMSELCSKYPKKGVGNFLKLPEERVSNVPDSKKKG